MASAAKRRCLTLHCNAIAVDKGRCTEHKQDAGKRSERATEWHALYNCTAWRRYRLSYLADHPLCVDPFLDHGPLVAATVVDHVKPHRGDYGMFWDGWNHQALCGPCNSKKAAKYEGGFGNA